MSRRSVEPGKTSAAPTKFSPQTKYSFVTALGMLVLGAIAVPPQVQKAPPSPEMVSLFEAKVRPVLIAKCYACHGPKQQVAGLRLDKPISPELAQSVAAVIAYTGDTKMPPAGKLPKDEVSALTTWAKAGAPWPIASAAKKDKAAFWAFQPAKLPSLPKVKAEWWAKNPLDRLVLAKLEAKGLSPAPVADRRTLIRRATFDLTGLPPTPAEIDAFLADKKPNAFERVIDRLLASTAYGERWGRHWLDVARYADSNGLDENLVFPNAWRYRDWVINSVNQDKPINRFIHEQIAGDLLPNSGDEEVIATGFLALGAKMLAEDDPVKQEMDIIDEQVDTLTKTFIGLTVGCARCHDHKFDPISAKDYYAMAGVFKSTQTMENFKVVADWVERPIGSKADQKKLAEINAQIKTKSEAASKIRAEEGKALLAKLTPQAPAYEKAAREYLVNEAKVANLKPANLETGAMILEAEDFLEGNVNRDKDGYGKGIGVLVNRGEFPNHVQYDVTVSKAGPYQLDIRYASGDSRSLRVVVNGKLMLSNAADDPTGGFYPEHQKWMTEGIVLLKAGKNQVKLERESHFPHIDKILFISRPGEAPTEVFDSALLPRIVVELAQKIKRGGEVKIELPERPDNLFSPEIEASLKKLDTEIAALDKSKPVVPTAMAVREGKPTDLKVHLRGNYLTLGEDSPRRFPGAVSPPNQPSIPVDRSGRLELAKWLTDARNPLTARVFVNRVWRWRFGRGLVGSVDNFGALGELPSHPELLDWLALSFVKEDGWSLKKLHKRMMLTNTYLMGDRYDKHAADIDPDNRLLWRFNRRRLEAEAIRDSLFFVAGKLDRKMGGTMMNLPLRAYVTTTEGNDPIKYDSPRRAVYLPVIRAAVYDVYTAFDFGDPSVMNGDRASTTVAPQALFMMNSQIVLKTTKDLAESLLAKTQATDDQRIRDLYLTCYGRPPTSKEIARSLEYLARFEAAYISSKSNTPKLSAWQSLCKAVVSANEFIYVE